MSTLVIRFSSLGDVVLAGSVTGALAPVTFLTLERYAAVAARLPGVERVLTWESHGRRAGQDCDRVVDLHNTPRSRWLTLGRSTPVERVERFDVRRRLRVGLKLGAPPPTVVDRYAKTAGTTPAKHPWIEVNGNRDALILVPGASHATKAWHPDGFIEIGKQWDGPVIVVGSQTEADRVQPIAHAIGPRAEALFEQGFSRTLDALGRARIVVGGDTGLTHLFAAAGAPAVTLFGPTTSVDGFACHPGTPVEVELPCRPCSRHGQAECPIGDHLCMTDIAPEYVWSLVNQSLEAA